MSTKPWELHFTIARAEFDPIYRVFLTSVRKTTAAPGFEPVTFVLATLPIGLLLDQDAADAQAIAESSGLRVTENEADDHFEDDFKEFHLTYPAGGPGEVYENDFVRFKVRRYGDSD